MEREIRIDEDNLPSDVVEAIRAGRKVVAIKLLRESTGLGLANAKVIVDRAAQQFSPGGAVFEPYTEETAANGRLLVMLLALIVAYLGYRWFAGG